MTNKMNALAAALKASTALTSGAKQIAMAQALLESGRGTSALFTKHNNPFGMKYRDRIADFADPVNYVASDGAGTYAAFPTLDAAVAGYATFIATGPYPEPDDDSAEAWLDALVEGGYATDPAYRSKVTALLGEAVDLLGEHVTSIPAVTASRSNQPKLGIVVGHNPHGKGAYAGAPLNVSEYDYNSEVAELMAEAAAEYGIDVAIIYREAGLPYSEEIDRAYAVADALNVDATVELHFNAAGLAVGTETLSSGSTGSLALANAIQRELVALFGRNGKSDRGVKILTPNDRGGRSLHAGRAPAIMTEPFFGSNPAEAALAAKIGKGALAEAYMNGISAWFAVRDIADAA